MVVQKPRKRYEENKDDDLKKTMTEKKISFSKLNFFKKIKNFGGQLNNDT